MLVGLQNGDHCSWECFVVTKTMTQSSSWVFTLTAPLSVLEKRERSLLLSNLKNYEICCYTILSRFASTIRMYAQDCHLPIQFAATGTTAAGYAAIYRKSIRKSI